MNPYFKMTGRVSRQTFIFATIVVLVVALAAALAAGFLLGAVGADDRAAEIVGTAIGLVASLVQAFLVVRRLHDIGKSGSHYWLLLLPFYSLYLSALLTFERGTRGPNAFGDDPLAG